MTNESEEYFEKDLPFPPLDEDVKRWRRETKERIAWMLDDRIIRGDPQKETDQLVSWLDNEKGKLKGS